MIVLFRGGFLNHFSVKKIKSILYFLFSFCLFFLHMHCSRSNMLLDFLFAPVSQVQVFTTEKRGENCLVLFERMCLKIPLCFCSGVQTVIVLPHLVLVASAKSPTICCSLEAKPVMQCFFLRQKMRPPPSLPRPKASSHHSLLHPPSPSSSSSSFPRLSTNPVKRRRKTGTDHYEKLIQAVEIGAKYMRKKTIHKSFHINVFQNISPPKRFCSLWSYAYKYRIRNKDFLLLPLPCSSSRGGEATLGEI